jgi:GNAT superfamily N-acetyltransferase
MGLTSDTQETARITVRMATAQDQIPWRCLWAGYLRFYQAEVPETVTQATWTRCLSEAWPMECLLAIYEGTVCGFAIVVIHPGTWSRKSVAYLEDLFVAPSARRLGVGRALLQALETRGHQFGWKRLYWQTKADNATAQALYDQMAQRTDWVRYDLQID